MLAYLNPSFLITDLKRNLKKAISICDILFFLIGIVGVAPVPFFMQERRKTGKSVFIKTRKILRLKSFYHFLIGFVFIYIAKLLTVA